MNPNKQQLLAHLQSNIGKKLSSYVVARSLGIGTKLVTPLLNELVKDGLIWTCAPIKITLYFVPTEEDIAAKSKVLPIAERKPYNPCGPDWKIVAERLAEFREIKSLIRSVP